MDDIAAAKTAEASEFALGPEIGSGAIATVFRAHHRNAPPESPASYAAKLLHPRHERDDVARRRFEREATLAKRLHHPNIVAVHGIKRIDGRSALLMELVEGPTLAEHLARTGPLPESDLLELIHGIASGLAFAHSCGVIHRDLKPANILLTTDAPALPKIADFGMARAASFASADKRAMTVLGTPPYMAPESMDPLAVDPRTDLYAFGCIVHELATGHPPYGGATPFAVLDAHRTAPIPKLPESFSDGLRNLTAGLLAKAPGERPQSASSVLERIERIRSTETALARRGPVQPSTLDDVAKGQCAHCKADVLPELRVCFRCGAVQAMVEPGKHCVIVVGPGKTTQKFDTELRNRLLEWLRANAAAGLDPTPLAQNIPRLAFALVTGVSPQSAQTLVSSLARLGILAQVHPGSPTSHPEVARRIRALSVRRLTITAAICGLPFFVHPILGFAVTVPGILISAPAAYLLSVRRASKPAVLHAASTARALPPNLDHRLKQLYGLVPRIDLARHRDALRAVVHRSVSLTRGLPPDEQERVDQEMAHAVNLASVAASRMNDLDRQMEHEEFDPAIHEHRQLMHERDTWSARLLDLTATLDALAARRAAAEATKERAEDADLLDALRGTVESLEEVQRL